LFSTTELHQLLKLPFLAEHFMEHKEQNNQITFWQFLYSHYALGDIQDADYEKDRKLPFKSHDCCNSMNVVAFIAQPVANIFLQIRPEYREALSFAIISDTFFNDSFLSNIWQPPRLN
jgi:hypothetical protein